MADTGTNMKSEFKQPMMISNLKPHYRVEVHRVDMGMVDHATVVHDHASIALQLSGTSTVWMNGVYTLGRGDVFLVPEGMPHYFIEADEPEALGMSMCLSCADFQAKEVLVRLFNAVHKGGCAKRSLAGESFELVKRTMLTLESELTASNSCKGMLVDALLTIICVGIERAGPLNDMAVVGDRPIIGEALMFISAHAMEGISLSDVASHVGRAPAHLASVIKANTGETVVGWITRSRMAAGRQLLLHTDETVESVAERCGFASLSHFHRVFKKTQGMTPGQWRQVHSSG